MIDEFGLYPREEPFDPFSVMLFKALQVVSFLFFLALLAISPEAKDGKIDSKAEFIITMDWPDRHPDDLDLFVQDPAACTWCDYTAACGPAPLIELRRQYKIGDARVQRVLRLRNLG